MQSIVSDRFGRLFGIRVRNQNTILINLPARSCATTTLRLTITYAGRLEPQRRRCRSRRTAGQAPSAAEMTPIAAARTQLPVQLPELLVSTGNRHGLCDRTASDWPFLPAFDVRCERTASDAGFPTFFRARNLSRARKLYIFTSSQPLAIWRSSSADSCGPTCPPRRQVLQAA